MEGGGGTGCIVCHSVAGGTRYAPWLCQWSYHLWLQGLHRWAMVIGLAHEDCTALQQCVPVLCVVHAATGWPRRKPQDVKWLWAWHFVRSGYNVVHMDADVFVLQDPLPFWNVLYHFQVIRVRPPWDSGERRWLGFCCFA